MVVYRTSSFLLMLSSCYGTGGDWNFKVHERFFVHGCLYSIRHIISPLTLFIHFMQFWSHVLLSFHTRGTSHQGKHVKQCSSSLWLEVLFIYCSAKHLIGRTFLFISGKKLVQEDGWPFRFDFPGNDSRANQQRYEDIGKVWTKRCTAIWFLSLRHYAHQ